MSYLQKNKMIQLGDFYRLYTYDPFKLIKSDSIHKKGRPVQISENYDKNKELYAENARRSLRDLVLSNLDYGNPRFITLTYATPKFDIKLVKRDFKVFIQRLRYHLRELGNNFNFRYISVPEQHDSDSTNPDRRYSYHFHVILFDLPYINTTFYSSTWKHGFIKINLIKGSPFATAYYLTKYLTKTDSHIRGQRRYLVSKNINRPKEIPIINMPLLYHKKTAHYNSFTGSTVRIDYYETYKQLQEKKQNNTFTITYGNR